MTLGKRLSALLSRYTREDKGSVVVMTALFSPLFIGGLGLGVETGHWYQKQRELQLIADLSANAAAARLRAGDDTQAIEAASYSIASASGLDAEVGAFVLNSPPVAGVYAGNGDAVEITISETHRRWFSAMFGDDNITLSARSVARIEQGSASCILALSDYADAAIDVAGSTDVNLVNCVVATNSVSPYAFKMQGYGSQMTVPCVFSVGGAIPTSNLTLTHCSSVKTRAPKTRDPYADLPMPAITGTCSSKNVGQSNRSTVVSPTDYHSSGMASKRFCGGLSIKGDVVFEPGLYIVDGGDFTLVGNSSINSPSGGVTFYLANGATLKLNANSASTLKAPTSGTYSGILFVGPRDNGIGGASSCNRDYSTEHKINGTAGLKLTGAIYLPSQDLTFNGNSDMADGCTQIVANTITLSGNSSLATEGCEPLGGKTIETNEKLVLAE